MELKTFVKVGNISNLSDARYCAGFGVNMLGFNLDPADPDHIATETAKEIMGWVAVDQFVLECGQMDAETVQRLSDEFSVQCVQVDSVHVADELIYEGYVVILRQVVTTPTELSIFKTLTSDLSYLLIESATKTLYAEIIDCVDKISNRTQVIKGFDVTEQNVLYTNSVFHGISLKGSLEEKAGFKDYNELADILEVLEVEN